ncbi:hypothetical protein [Sphingomonas jatrophae]|uniref:Uncharacterized protein n=1 Tax=Sphingomonas jatrophae TaxID=1166337 RepID=A0A1I6K2Z1_9SPHN|nr:hypothetical protein [Sphingomonas jatrophae]SFR85635.1 hypothetical protein SAMN05192580_1279 [Sphingomonas jatrophae]
MLVIIYWNCVALVLAVTITRGGRPEQFAGVILVLASALGLAAASDPDTSFREVEWDIFAIDILSFGGLLALALRANRYWPSCTAGLKLAPIAGHIAKAIDPGSIAQHSYGWLNVVLTYPFMAVIVVAVLRHRTRAQRHGVDAPWR